METRKLQVTVPVKMVEALNEFSKERGLTKSVIMTLAVEEYLARERGKQLIQQAEQ